MENEKHSILSADFWANKLKTPENFGHWYWVDGRVGRLHFLLYYLLFIFCMLVIFTISKDIPDEILMIPLYFFICLLCKRLHDLGLSALWCILYILVMMNSNTSLLYAFVNSVLVLPLFIIKGTDKELKKRTFLGLKKISPKIYICLFLFLILICIGFIFK